MRSTWASRLLAGVGDLHRLVEIAHDLPMLLVGDLEEVIDGRVVVLELVEQRGAFPWEGEEGLLDFPGELRLEIVDRAIGGRREAVRGENRLHLLGLERAAG